MGLVANTSLRSVLDFAPLRYAPSWSYMWSSLGY